MTLKEQLANIFEDQPGVLPSEPEQAILGTELIMKVRPKLQGDYPYTDNAIRATIATLAQEPTSPIARREGSQGYYRRQRPLAATSGAATSPEAVTEAEDIVSSRGSQPEEKFRSFFLRYSELNDDKFPVAIEHTTAKRQESGVNRWKFPDVILLDWDVKDAETGVSLDPVMFEVMRGLGEPPFHLISAELKVDLSLATFRQFFFQCVSNSKWAHQAHLVTACSIVDSLLINELRRLGNSFGVAVSTFDFTRSELDGLPDAETIRLMDSSVFQQMFQGKIVKPIASGVNRISLDWDHIRDMRTQSTDFSEVFDWIAKCIELRRPYTIGQYRQLVEIERAAQ
ncbi:hypothetical protein KQX64_23285 [Rhodopseudomonas palustris]|nr:hypothetical protein KQX64_23285 [Rhodopseudomonas palustris]